MLLHLLSRTAAAAATTSLLVASGVAAALKNEGWINAGDLGVAGARVAAWGDANGDQYIDAFAVDDNASQLTVYLWNHGLNAFKAGTKFKTLPSIQNVVPSDFNQDGVLDVLVMSSGKSGGSLRMQIFLGIGDGLFAADPIDLPDSSFAQPLLTDVNGNLAMDLLGHVPGGTSGLKVWKNTMASNNTFAVESILPDSKCQLNTPHSSAYVDIDGDCIADLFLVCQGKSMDAPHYEVWTASGDDYKMSSSGDFPSGTGMLSFADFDRDGTIDIVYPSCVGSKCYVNVADNKQVPLCSTQPADWTLPWLTGNKTSSPSSSSFEASAGAARCRDLGNLCTADPSFQLDLQSRRFSIADLLGGAGWSLMLTDASVTPARPIPISVGDYNKDGYPDLLLVATNDKNGGRSEAVLLTNTRCSKAPVGAPGCSADEVEKKYGSDWDEARTFVRAAGSEGLQAIENVVGASFVDLDEDGSLDILLQTLTFDGNSASNRRPVHSTVFMRNYLFFDSFFLKLLMLNGACDGFCPPLKSSGENESSTAKGESFKPWGVNYAGASYKFTVLDPNGLRRAQHVGQLAQTGYGALLTPSTYLGLGRTNNYVELLEVGSSRRQGKEQRVLSMEGVIPNSQIYINPWQPPVQQDSGSSAEETTKAATGTWSKEMYLHPGEWIVWVLVVLVAIVVVLCAIVVLLHLHERREDEKERKRAVYAINFDAL